MTPEQQADFKTKMTEVFIPAIRGMAKKEKEHLENLKKARSWFHDTTTVDQFIARSERYLLHYETRLEQYIEFALKM